MSTQQITQALSTLNKPPTLSILTLSEPVLLSSNNRNDNKNPTPATLEGDSLHPSALAADLAHYKDLFAKLRFSYVEQVTKERFLKAVVADPPELVDAAQNAELEDQLQQAKAGLKRKKVAMEHMVQALEDAGRSLAQSYDIVQLQTTQLSTLPTEIAYLESHISALRSAAAPSSSNPELNLSLPSTASLLDTRQAELEALDRQIQEMQSALPAKKRQVAALEAELVPLETKKRAAIDEAREAQRKRGNGAMATELEERGRWLKAVDGGLRGMLQA